VFGLGPTEVVVIGVIAVILFGGNLPDVARKFGGSYREFRRGLNDMQQQFRMVESEVKKTLDAKLDDKKKDYVEDDEDDFASSAPKAPKFKPPV
jgi:sec-independent protein translocase protein TatA